ncbi:MAG TPA: sodium:solute symporter family protein [Bacillales bacterium]|nr:sodium:solute symporter family protein [Bacillales bacterium]
MADWTIALIMMIAYLVIALIIGVWAGKGRGGSLNEYVVAGGGLGLFVMWFLMGGAVFSAFSFLGAPGWAYSKGAPAYYIIVYTAFAILPWYIIGPKIKKIGQKFDLYTISGFYKGRYQTKVLPVVVGLLAVFAFIQYLTTQMKGMAYIFEIMTAGHIPFWLGALLAYGIVVVYVATGGLRAAAWSDVFQGILMIVISWVVGIAVVMQLHGGSGNMFASIMQNHPGFLEIGHEGSNMSGIGYTTTILVSIFGFMMWPHLFSKSYATKGITIKRTVLAYPIFALFLIPLLFIGFAAIGVVDYGTLDSPDQILPYLVTSVLQMPGWVYGLIGAGALAAAMSSADAITHSASLEFTNGVVHNIWPSLSDQRTLAIMRIAVIVIGACAYFLTVFGSEGLIALLLGAYGSIVQFAPGVYSAMYWRRATPTAVISGLIVGTVVNYYYQLVAASTPMDINAGILGLIANLIVLIVVSYATKPQDKKVVSEYVDAN